MVRKEKRSKRMTHPSCGYSSSVPKRTALALSDPAIPNRKSKQPMVRRRPQTNFPRRLKDCSRIPPASGSVTAVEFERARQSFVQQSFFFVHQLCRHLALAKNLLSRRNFLNMLRQSFV